ncbi:NYN domain protein [uncultured archaeon]|nr:NYN domain protein [uncultured archaeon]
MLFNMKKRAVFLIDSGYLSFITKFLGGGKHLKFKIEDFVKNISNKSGCECDLVYFYTAPPYQNPIPTKEENERKANYDKFISKLKQIKHPQLIIREGRCQKIKNDYCQKGVDTLITMDLVKFSIDNSIDKILFMTADTDFAPIMKEVAKDKELVLIYFTDKRRKSAFTLSNRLWNICSKKIKIDIQDFRYLI